MYKKRFLLRHLFVAMALLLFIGVVGCNDDEADDSKQQTTPVQELLLGSWSRYNNRVYTLLIIRAMGNWSSDFRVEGATSKIVERKGEATGTWKLEDNHLIMTVLTSQMEDVWPLGEFPLEIIEIDKRSVTLKYPNSRLITWKKARVEKEKKSDDPNSKTINPVIPMKPIVVNLNKISSNDKDRYLCLALDLHLEEMEITTPIPKLHPRAWDATILYLSSLMYNDVKTFDEMKIVTERLTKILNPYLDGLLVEVASTHVMVSSSMDKVDEFLIEHLPPPTLETPEEAKSEEEKKAAEKETEKDK